MSQKEMIVNLLKENESMTQGDLAAAIYGDKNHSSQDLLKRELCLEQAAVRHITP